MAGLAVVALTLAGAGGASSEEERRRPDSATATAPAALSPAVIGRPDVPAAAAATGTPPAARRAMAPAPAPAPGEPGTEPASPATTVPLRPGPPGRGAPPCRNSTDPACGPFSWDPAPRPDRPLTITLEVLPAEPRAGEQVTVRVVATDPDAPVTTNGGTYFWDDPHDTGAQVGFAATLVRGQERFGPWTPPVPEPGRLEIAFTHTFSQPGTFRFHFEARSGDESDPGNPARHPYAGTGSASVEITVADAPAPGPLET